MCLCVSDVQIMTATTTIRKDTKNRYGDYKKIFLSELIRIDKLIDAINMMLLGTIEQSPKAKRILLIVLNQPIH